jgi:hypothetical protein
MVVLMVIIAMVVLFELQVLELDVHALAMEDDLR